MDSDDKTGHEEPMTAVGILKVAGAGVAIAVFSPVIIAFAMIGWVSSKRENAKKEKAPKPRSARVVKILG